MASINNSGFASNFSNQLTDEDILTSVSSPKSSLATVGLGSAVYYGRYFYLGNLLFQFTDFSGGLPSSVSGGSNKQINFPIPFSSTPYTVIATGFGESGSTPVNITVTSIAVGSFTFSINLNSGGVSFLAIGPR